MKHKPLDLLLAKANPRKGQIYDTKSLKLIFGYSERTYVRDTALYQHHIIEYLDYNRWIIQERGCI